jgi:peptide-methionine (S)-S-oxide reductase
VPSAAINLARRKRRPYRDETSHNQNWDARSTIRATAGFLGDGDSLWPHLAWRLAAPCTGIKGGYDTLTSMKVRLLFTLCSFVAAITIAQAATKPASKTEFATFGGGCFWCMEAVFQRLPGVIHSVSGYSGGHTSNPTYEEVCDHGSGHAEVIQVEFDPAVINYGKVLEVFFESHNPTTLNRQGADVGDQYRSVIFYHNEDQHQIALRAKTAAQASYDDPIVTEIVPLKKFWRAEDSHQNYFNQHPDQQYCSFVIKPKVSKLQKKGVISKD